MNRRRISGIPPLEVVHVRVELSHSGVGDSEPLAGSLRIKEQRKILTTNRDAVRERLAPPVLTVSNDSITQDELKSNVDVFFKEIVRFSGESARELVSPEFFHLLGVA